MSASKVLLAAAVAILAGVGPSSAQQVLKVATNPAPSALGGFDPKTKVFDGMAVEFLTLIAEDAGLRVEFVALPVGDQAAALTGKRVDIVASDLAPPPGGALAKAGEASYTYATFRDVLLFKDGNKKNIQTPADLKGMNLAILKGTDFADELPKLGARVKPYDTARELLAAVDAGAVEGAILYSHIAKEALKDNSHPTLVVGDPYMPPIRSSEMVFLVQHGNAALLQTINDSMQKILFGKAGTKVAFKWGVAAEKSFISEPCICAGP